MVSLASYGKTEAPLLAPVHAEYLAACQDWKRCPCDEGPAADDHDGLQLACLDWAHALSAHWPAAGALHSVQD